MDPNLALATKESEILNPTSRERKINMTEGEKKYRLQNKQRKTRQNTAVKPRGTPPALSVQSLSQMDISHSVNTTFAMNTSSSSSRRRRKMLTRFPAPTVQKPLLTSTRTSPTPPPSRGGRTSSPSLWNGVCDRSRPTSAAEASDPIPGARRQQVRHGGVSVDLSTARPVDGWIERKAKEARS